HYRWPRRRTDVTCRAYPCSGIEPWTPSRHDWTTRQISIWTPRSRPGTGQGPPACPPTTCATPCRRRCPAPSCAKRRNQEPERRCSGAQPARAIARRGRGLLEIRVLGGHAARLVHRIFPGVLLELGVDGLCQVDPGDVGKVDRVDGDVRD